MSVIPVIINQNNLTFEINKKDYTAKIIKSDKEGSDIFIPKSIDYLSSKYIITRIENRAFSGNNNIRNISFAPDSEIQSLGRESFAYSSIESISIPKSVKTIEHLAFYNCRKLKTMDIPENSELISFGCNPFGSTLIEKIYIPQNVTKINQSLLKGFSTLKSIAISPKNKKFTHYNDFVIGKSSFLYDQLVFVPPNCREIEIPSFIKEINSFSVSNCSNLESVNFESDSKLCQIGEDFLKGSLVKCISVPKQIKIFGVIEYEKLNFVEYLADEFQTDFTVYKECSVVISLPNCKKIHVEIATDADITILIHPYANVTWSDISGDVLFSGFEF